PLQLFSFFSNSLNFLTTLEELEVYLSEFVNNYSFYGLSLKRIGFTNHFFRKYREFIQNSDESLKFKKIIGSKNVEKYIDEEVIHYSGRDILISHNNLNQIYDQIHLKPRKFEFLMLGMVVKGGLGPGGYGFVYLTNRGELVEICTDVKLNNAYIVHFKQFLKDEFIKELETRIRTLYLTSSQKERLLDILDGRLPNNDKFGYTRENFIVRQVRDFLEDEFDFNRLTSDEKMEIFKVITKKIHAILQPVTIIDQYQCRLKLVASGKVKAQEIAKLTSIGEISHYDLLTERYFYQSLIRAFKRYYINDQNEDLFDSLSLWDVI
ncbi:MAG: hypothetical protein ACTSUI_08360, partial [Promethearchaeota archaeon]